MTCSAQNTPSSCVWIYAAAVFHPQPLKVKKYLKFSTTSALMANQSIIKEEELNPFPFKENLQRLRKAVSDASYEIDKYYTNMEAIEEVQQIECECCGMKEECTEAYISEIEEGHCGKWVCGLCSEAVKERQRREPAVVMQEAVRSHKEFCRKYNSTTRLNPKLSLTLSMRDIAKRSSERRNSKGLNATKLGRSTSYP